MLEIKNFFRKNWKRYLKNNPFKKFFKKILIIEMIKNYLKRQLKDYFYKLRRKSNCLA